MIEFLRYAKLQPLDRNLVSRLAQAMSVSDPFAVALSQAEEATNVKGALQLLKHACGLSTETLGSNLDEIFTPLTPRYYSIASHIRIEPTAVEIVVGRVQYQAKALTTRRSSLSVSGKHRLDDLTKFTTDISSKSSTENGNDEGRTEPRIAEPSIEQRRTKSGTVHLEEDTDTHALPQEDTDPEIFSTSFLESYRISDEASLETVAGTCSSYLQSLSPGHRLTVRIVPKLDFHLPQDPTVPIIMIAHGTGFAPFRSFLKEFVLQKHSGSVQRKKCWLILGVKSRHQIPFISEIEEAVYQHKVAGLSLAISREDFELDSSATSCNPPHLRFRAARRKHIADLFGVHRSELHKLWQLVTRDGAHIYVCGKPSLELTTRRALADAARRFAPMKKRCDGVLEHAIDATSFANRVCANKRLHAGCYDSGHAEQRGATYSRAEVAQHRTTSDCWVTFRDGVYDISQFLQVHPGGPKLLLTKAGQDITADFETTHGADNYRVASILHAYQIGRLERFEGALEEVRSFMHGWSERLLAKVQERHCKFELNWNQFEEIDMGEAAPEAGGGGRYTKHDEAVQLLRNYVRCDEPEMFALVKQFVCEELGQQLPRAQFDAQRAMSRLEAARKGAMTLDEDIGSGWGRTRTHAMLQRCAAAMEQFLEVASALQRVVERVARCSASGGGGGGGGGDGGGELVNGMVDELAPCVVYGVEGVYRQFRR